MNGDISRHSSNIKNKTGSLTHAFILKADSSYCRYDCVSLCPPWRRFSLLCALHRLQLGAEVHAPLNRPHLHLSIDERTTEARRWRLLSVNRLSGRATGPSHWDPADQWSWRGCNRGENSSISQLVCGSSGVAQYLNYVWFEEEEAHVENIKTPPDQLQGPCCITNWYNGLTQGWIKGG